MSQAPSPQQAARLTIASIARLYAEGERIAMLTAYDYPTARILDEAGIPMLLVGDSLGQVMLGYDSTVRVTMAEMLHHTKAVVRGTRRALVVADMPFLSYGVTPEASLENAGVMMREGGAGAVKLEGGERSARTIETIVRAGIPVMGHIGLTPQSIHQLGGHRVQGKTREAGRQLLADALAVQQAGAFAVVLELVPEQLAAAITERLHIPTIGIGAGAGCSGQVQVITDLLGISADFTPQPRPPLRRAALDHQVGRRGLSADASAPAPSPGPAESTRMDDGTLDEILGRTPLDRPDDGRGEPTAFRSTGTSSQWPARRAAPGRPDSGRFAGRAGRGPPAGRPGADDGRPARRPRLADPAGSAAETRRSWFRSSSTRASSTRRSTSRSIRATRQPTSGSAAPRARTWSSSRRSRRSTRPASRRRVRVGALTEPLEGASRPGHFEGVTTVVAILLTLAGAERAYFGQKDAQQLLVVRRMAARPGDRHGDRRLPDRARARRPGDELAQRPAHSRAAGGRPGSATGAAGRPRPLRRRRDATARSSGRRCA